jgi:superfamily II DNA or RNA helicase
MFLDNRKNKVSDLLIAKTEKGSRMSVVSAYFTIFAYDRLRKELEGLEKFRFLFVEPTFTKRREETREYYISRLKREKSLSGGELEIRLRNQLTQTSVAKECASWIRSKAEFRSLVNPDATSARAVHVTPPVGGEFVVQGTVDFTASGLGFSPSPKLESNVFSQDPTATREMLQWFDGIWQDQKATEDVTEAVLDGVANIYKENSPEFLYFVTLYNLFREYLETLDEDAVIKPKTKFKETAVWNKLYKFQRDGVLGAIDKLEKHNGCIIADSVGLGKTFEALAVIKYYELRNHRVLVLCPKKLRDNWTMYRSNDRRNVLAADRLSYEVLNHTDLSRKRGFSGDTNLETVNWGNYDLVVVDESHNFRNNNPHKDHVTRYRRLMDDVIRSGVKTKVLMLSATPVNNRMADLKNQIAFITEGRDEALADNGIKSIDRVLQAAQTRFSEWMKLPAASRTTEELLKTLHIDYFRLLDTVTIARSRKHIEKYYDAAEVGKFPERLRPVNVKTAIDSEGGFPALSGINGDILLLNMALYSPLAYLLPQKREEYAKKYDIKVRGGGGAFSMADREKSLVNLMRVNILKRLESSVHSFKLTLGKILAGVDKALASADAFDPSEGGKAGYEMDDDSVVRAEGDGAEDEGAEDDVIGGKVKVRLADMDLVRWREDLDRDRQLLLGLKDAAMEVTPDRDAKLAHLKDLIAAKVRKPLNAGNRKVLVFSAFADTADYLHKNLADWALAEFGVYTAKVTGAGRNKNNLPGSHPDYTAILTDFSPVSKERALLDPDAKGEIDLLIATDCISEGQNLQDCDFLVNYDIHWNPVRIIQRFGRIDRIGSKNDKVQLVNFWPDIDLDEYIKLEDRVSGRMKLLDISATGEENVIETSASGMNDLEYRKTQLLALQNRVPDMEDVNGGLSITDLTLNDFRMDLAEYAKGHKDVLEKAATGMYAVATTAGTPLEGALPKGVLFALRHAGLSGGTPEEPNALHPYYLLYVAETGEVKLSCFQAKQVLDLFRRLCMGKAEPNRELAAAFARETDDGADMAKYSGLLRAAAEHVVGKRQEAGMDSLFRLGATAVADATGGEDFELVSFLVVR